MSVRIKDVDHGVKELIFRFKSSAVTVGVHADDGAAPVKTMQVVTRYAGMKGNQHVTPVRDKEGRLKHRATEDTSGATVAEVAAAHELGVAVPRRSWLCDWVDQEEDVIRKKMQAEAQLAVKKRRFVSDAVDKVGRWAVGKIRGRIRAGLTPELSGRRIAEKAQAGSKTADIPLIFTGQFIRSIKSRSDTWTGQ